MRSAAPAAAARASRPAGEQLLRAAGEVARARDAVLQKLRAGAPALGALGLRTSMRNQVPSRIHRMRMRAGAMDVDLALGGAVLRSRITRESAQLLGLARQQDVLALCKATAVDVRAEVPAQWSDNVLAGVVTRAPRAQGGEVALALAGGVQLVGFAAAASGLRAGHAAFARVDPSAVVIALP